MRHAWPLISLLVLSCAGERVPVEIAVDRGGCQGGQIELYLLRILGDKSTCIIARGTNEALPSMQIADDEVILLALVSGEVVPDGAIQDSLPATDSYYSPDAYSPDAYSPDAYSPDAGQSYCGDNDCDPSAGENCSSCPQDCGACVLDASSSSFALISCIRCYGLARVTLGSKVEPVTIRLAPTPSPCNVPSSAQEQLGLKPAPLPPGDCQ